jgi:ribosome-associated protein
MQAKKMQQLISEALEDAKGQDIRVLDVRRITDFTDYMIIVTGTSNRHVVSMADRVRDRLRAHGQRPLGIEGEDLGDWVLIDVGDVVVHIMRPQTRDFYNLEKLWGDSRAVGAAER